MKLNYDPQEIDGGSFVFGNMTVEDNALILNNLGGTLSRKQYSNPASAFRELYLNARESNQDIERRTGKAPRRTEVILPSRFKEVRDYTPVSHVNNGDYHLADAPGQIMAHAEESEEGNYRELTSGEMKFIFDPSVDWRAMHSTMMIRNYGTTAMTGDQAWKYATSIGLSSKSGDDFLGGGLGVGIMAGMSVSDDVTFHVVNGGTEDFIRLTHRDGAVIPGRMEPHSRPTSDTEDHFTVSQVVDSGKLEEVFVDSLYLLLTFPEDEAVDVMLPPYLYDRVAKILAEVQRPSAESSVHGRARDKQGEWQFLPAWPYDESTYENHRFTKRSERYGIKVSIDGCHYPTTDEVTNRLKGALSARLKGMNNGTQQENDNLVKAVLGENVLRYNAPVGQFEVSASRELATPRDDSFYDMIVKGLEDLPLFHELIERMERSVSLRKKIYVDHGRDDMGFKINPGPKKFTKARAKALRDYLNEFVTPESGFMNVKHAPLPDELLELREALEYFTFEAGDKIFLLYGSSHIRMAGTVGKTVPLEDRFKNYDGQARARMSGLNLAEVEEDWERELFETVSLMGSDDPSKWNSESHYTFTQASFAKDYESLPEEKRTLAEKILGNFDNYDFPYSRQDFTLALNNARETGALPVGRSARTKREVQYRYRTTLKASYATDGTATEIMRKAKETQSSVVLCNFGEGTPHNRALGSIILEWSEGAKEYWGGDFVFVLLSGTQKFPNALKRLNIAAQEIAEEDGDEEQEVYEVGLEFLIEVADSLYQGLPFPAGLLPIALHMQGSAEKAYRALIPEHIPDEIMNVPQVEERDRDLVDSIGKVLDALRNAYFFSEGEDSWEENKDYADRVRNAGEHTEGYVDPSEFFRAANAANAALLAMGIVRHSTDVSALSPEQIKEARKYVKQTMKFQSAMKN